MRAADEMYNYMTKWATTKRAEEDQQAIITSAFSTAVNDDDAATVATFATADTESRVGGTKCEHYKDAAKSRGRCKQVTRHPSGFCRSHQI